MEQKIEKLVEWLQTKGKEANVKVPIIGMSDGIDSAVVTQF